MGDHQHDPKAFAKWQAEQKKAKPKGINPTILAIFIGVSFLGLIVVVSALYNAGVESTKSPEYQHGYENGYTVGFARGRDGKSRDGAHGMWLSTVHSDGNANYENGFQLGYNTGWHDGKARR